MAINVLQVYKIPTATPMFFVVFFQEEVFNKSECVWLLL